jgi:hypothetical protein
VTAQNQNMGISKIEAVVLAILLSIFFLSRLYALDADIPLWHLSHYSPIDEFYYTAFSFDLVEGRHAPDGKILSSQYAAYNMLQQYITAGSLWLLGDNYYGLRTPSVLAGALVLIAFYLLILRRFGLYYAIAFSTLLMTELSFTLASRIAEPTIFRMAAAALLLLYITRTNFNTNKQIVALGCLICLAWLFVYPTNAFLGLVGFGAIAISNRSAIIFKMRFYLAGVLLVIALYLTCYFAQGNNIADLLTTKSIFSERVSSHDRNTLLEILAKLFAVRKAEFFVSHPYFLFATIASLFFLSALAAQQSKLVTKTDQIILLFTLCFLLQCAFINDYPERKLVFILPISLYLCCFSICFFLDKFKPRHASALSASLVSILTYLFAAPTFSAIYTAPAYNYKYAMRALSFLGQERIIGGWSYGFRLYNDYRPYLNQYTIIYTQPQRYYQLLTEAGLRGEAPFTIEYGDAKSEQPLKNAGFTKKQIIFESNDPVYPDVYLYAFDGQPTALEQRAESEASQ